MAEAKKAATSNANASQNDQVDNDDDETSEERRERLERTVRKQFLVVFFFRICEISIVFF